MFLTQLRSLQLATPALLCLTLLVPAVLLLFRWRPVKLPFPRVRLVSGLKPRRLLRRLPATLFSLAIFSLALAAAGPYLPFAYTQTARKGCAITIALDISKSMLWAADEDHKSPQDGQLNRFQLSCALIRQLALHCEKNSPGDVIQVIVFDESARVALTFTGDFKQIYRKVDLLTLTRGLDDDLDGGTNFGGRGPGPIDLAAEEFDAIYAPSDARLLVVLTDGDDKLDQSPEAPNRTRLQQLLTRHGMRMDVVGVGPALLNGTADIISLSRSVGGRTFSLGSKDQSAQFLDSVRALKRVSLPGDQVQERVVLFSIFATCGAALLLGWLWSEAKFLNS